MGKILVNDSISPKKSLKLLALETSQFSKDLISDIFDLKKNL